MNRFLKAAYDYELSQKIIPLVNKIEGGSIKHLDTMSREFTWCRDVAIMELLFATGLRVAELCSLYFADYNAEDNSFHIIGKGDKERFVYVETKQAQKMLSAYLRLRRAIGIDLPNIFVTKFRAPMSTQGVRNIVTKYAKLSGIPKNITPHVFRHSFATLLIESGVDIKYIQDFLGHSTISTTQIYLHISDEQKKKVLAAKHPRDKMCASLNRYEPHEIH
jgi:integrase/recombinase XerD